ncbi:hypothetical protein I317_06751 [Kwoniella heveanensis CBS 569]|uniref:Ribosome maturation protein SDO1/SBDS N-terminal domain-containing protein n=1 Tax=Kwoniella heveanensis BCC8398 TaxID=1296120 RepID=A0A1B9GM60_9TREE|nr:hypothetical protein I316_06227 [Kwoniella heveanensis BCC8398]OCF39427.1 hypothetical protein I317_06751 [Kwoniella heveanensis CBS 569]
MSANALIWSPENSQDQYIVMIDDVNEYEQWKAQPAGGKDIALSRFLGQFTIYKTTTGVGHTGTLGEVSKQEIQNVFFGGDSGKHVEDAIIVILNEGKIHKGDLHHTFKLTKNAARGAGEVRGIGAQQGQHR